MYREPSGEIGLEPLAERPIRGNAQLAALRAKRRSGEILKRLVDIVGASTILFLTLPLFAFLAIGVCLSSPGPVFYSQPRVGRGGRIFRFYKFRSMAKNSDYLLTSFLDSDPDAKVRWDKYQKIDNDPRITKFGRFIRRTSLDELPQLWNILLGDMSLVGPRPCMPQQQALYGNYWTYYCAVRPGLTGLWQVSGRNRLTYDARVKLDLAYITNWTIWLDARILVRTVGVVLSADGSH